MANPLSFTQGHSVRYPGPDVARGFMLLLIALANVTYWASAVGTQVYGSYVDSVLALMRVAFVDQRAYPLFAVLFGFGLMTMVKRRRQSFVSHAIQGLEAQGYVVAPLEQGHSLAGLFQRDSMVTARRLLRRRGLWMLLFGGVHALLFPGDIIGAYALIAIVLAGLFARENVRALLSVAGVFAVLSVVQLSVVAFFDPSMVRSGFGVSYVDYSLSGLASNLGLWALGSAGTVFSSFAVAGACLGGYLATKTFVSDPEGNRHFLEIFAAVGLLVGFLGALPFGLIEAEMVNMELRWWMVPLNHVAGFCGALGWLALLVVFAGPAPMLAPLSGLRWVLSALGRRSMSGYVAQSLLFACVFLPLYGDGVRLPEVATALIACGVWGLTLAAAVLLEAFGCQGPLERLLREVVARSGRRELPALPSVLVDSLPMATPVSAPVAPSGLLVEPSGDVDGGTSFRMS